MAHSLLAFELIANAPESLWIYWRILKTDLSIERQWWWQSIGNDDDDGDLLFIAKLIKSENQITRIIGFLLFDP